MAVQEVWVELEVNKGAGFLSTYRGRLERSVLERWVAGTHAGAVVIDDAYWWAQDPESGDGAYIVIGQTDGNFANGTGRVYVRSDTIVAILELHGGEERDSAIVETLGSSNPQPD